MLRLFAHRPAVLVVVLVVEVVAMLVVELDAVVVVVSQSLQVLAHRSKKARQTLTANKSLHFLKGNMFFFL